VKECTVASKYDMLHSYTGGTTTVNPTYKAPYLTMAQASRIVQQQVFQNNATGSGCLFTDGSHLARLSVHYTNT